MTRKAPASSGTFKVSASSSTDRPLSKKEKLVRRKAEKAAKRRRKEEQHHREAPELTPDAATEPPAEGEGERHQREAHAPPETHPISDSDSNGEPGPEEGKETRKSLFYQTLEVALPPISPDRSDAESIGSHEAMDLDGEKETDSEGGTPPPPTAPSAARREWKVTTLNNQPLLRQRKSVSQKPNS